MKRFLVVVANIFLISFITFSTTIPISAQDAHVTTDSKTSQPEKVLIYFHGEGCPHCAKVDAWMESENIRERYPELDNREIYNNRDNAVYFNEIMDSLNIPLNNRGVPTLVVGEQVIVGDAPIIDNFYTVVNEYLGKTDEVTQNTETEEVTTETENQLSIWIIISASLVDAINPCAFAVLIILISTILIKRDKRTALLSGLSFSLAIFTSYVLMGLGIYSAINATGITDTITTVVGVLAIVLGLFNLKDFFWYGKGTLMEVPKRWRPTMKKLIERATSPVGAFVIAFLVSLFLLPCTSGPYIVVLGLLAQNPLDAGAIGYLILYNLIFVAPMVLITLSAYKGVDIEKLEYTRKANLEKLHLIAGLLLIGLGVFVLLF